MAEDSAKQLTTAIQSKEGTADQVGVSTTELRRIVRAEIRRLMPSVIDAALARRGDDEEVAGMVRLLAAKSTDAKDEVLRKALTLYGVALDAREKGNKLAIITPDDLIVHDVIGFEPAVEVPGPVTSRG